MLHKLPNTDCTSQFTIKCAHNKPYTNEWTSLSRIETCDERAFCRAGADAMFSFCQAKLRLDYRDNGAKHLRGLHFP